MKFQFHNKLTLKVKGKLFEFYNTMFESVYDRLSNLKSYFDYIAIGSGTKNGNTDYKLENFLATYPLTKESINDNLEKQTLFSKKIVLIGDSKLDGKYLTEVGITSSTEDNPIVYNYFSLICSKFPNGILKVKGEPIEISICIYLNLSADGQGLLTAGNNPFINFLLGEGTNNQNFYAVRGNLFLDNTLTQREPPLAENKFLCSITTNKENGLEIKLTADLLSGETHEIVLLLGDAPFARINVEKYYSLDNKTAVFTAKANYVLDLGKNVTEVKSITNNSTGELENNVYVSKYAIDFGDKLSLPFHNMFDAETPRFLSKDGDKIFFVLEDTIYAYKNINYKIEEINTNGATLKNITKIISFDKYVFVTTKTEPFISAFIIEDNKFKSANINFSNYERLYDFENIFDIDITQAKNGIFMLGYIEINTYNGYAIYFSYDNETNTFNFDSYFNSDYRFTYVLAMYKNNFSDATLFFLKGGDHSYECNIVTFYPDKTFKDVYTIICYYYTYETKEIYTKGRAVVVEKTSSPHMWIYFYPQIYRYNLEILGDELDDYVSTNMLYLIQKKTNDHYEIYNLVGYNTPTKFINGLPKEIDQSKIESFEFLNDTLLIFLSDNENRICAYNLKEDNLLVENVSSNKDSYTIDYNSYHLIGSNNEGVIVNFTINITI